MLGHPIRRRPSPAVARLLQPLAAAGSMVLTLYSAHLVVLASGFLDDDPALLYVVLVVAALTFAWVWRRVLGRGPLERVVTAASGATRRAVVTAKAHVAELGTKLCDSAWFATRFAQRWRHPEPGLWTLESARWTRPW